MSRHETRVSGFYAELDYALLSNAHMNGLIIFEAFNVSLWNAERLATERAATGVFCHSIPDKRWRRGFIWVISGVRYAQVLRPGTVRRN